MIELNDEQRQQLDSGKVLPILDPQSAKRYVILRQDVYERVCRLLYDDAESTDAELRQRLALSAAENGWHEPGMDAYDRYDVGIIGRI